MLGAQRHHKLLVRLLLTTFVKYTHMSLASIKCLAGLAQPARQPVVDQCQFQHTFERLEHAHLRRAAGPAGRNFDFGSVAYAIGIRNWGSGLFSVRLFDGPLASILPRRNKGEKRRYNATEAAERTISGGLDGCRGW